MSYARNVLAWMALVAPVVAAGAKPAPPPAPSFGLSVARSKIGDASGSQPLYGGGQHAMARFGNDVVVAYPAPGTPSGVVVLLGRSADGGLTWLPSSTITYGGDGISDIGTPLAVGPDPAGGSSYRVHVCYAQGSGYYYTYATIDPGAAAPWLVVGRFSTPLLVSGAASGNGYCSLAADPSGGVHIAFDGTIDGVGGVRYSRSADYGATFVETAVLVAQDVHLPALVADAVGDVYVAFSRAGIATYVATRVAGAPAFGAPVVATATGSEEISLASSPDGTRLYLAWTYDIRDQGGAAASYHVARSMNGGATWATSDGSLVGGCFFGPSIALSQMGNVGLAFTDFCSAELRFVRSTDEGQSWSAPAVITSAPWGATLFFDAADKANIAFVNDPNGSAVYFTKEK